VQIYCLEEHDDHERQKKDDGCDKQMAHGICGFEVVQCLRKEPMMPGIVVSSCHGTFSLVDLARGIDGTWSCSCLGLEC
jgi:hypothetical protein